MQVIETLFGQYLGLILGGLGAAIAMCFAGIGSAKGVGMTGEAASALVKEKPELFGQALVLQLLPATQGLYGFIVALMIILRLDTNLATSMGWYYMVSAIPVGLVGFISAPAQARVSVAGMQILTKHPENSTQGIAFSAMVETYAILGLVISLLMLLFV